MDELKTRFVYFLAKFVVLACCSHATMTIIGHRQVGMYIFITCNWNLSAEETTLEVTITSRPNSPKDFIFRIHQTSALYVTSGAVSSFRYSLADANTFDRDIRFDIDDLRFTDECVYYCVYKIGLKDGSFYYRNDSGFLVVRGTRPDTRNQFLVTTTNLGEKLLFSCNSIKGNQETVEYILVRKLPMTSESDFFINFTRKGGRQVGINYQARIKDFYYHANDSVSFRFDFLVCSDTGTYKCDIEYRRNVDGIQRQESFEKNITLLSAPPQPPEMKVSIISHRPSDDLLILEVNFTCKANLGSPGYGTLVWRLNHECVSEIITEDDHRIVSRLNASNQQEKYKHDSCTNRMEHVLGIHLFRREPGLTIDCYVVGSSSSSLVPPLFCENTAKQLCARVKLADIVSPNLKVGYKAEGIGENMETIPFVTVMVVVAGVCCVAVGIFIGVVLSMIKKVIHKYAMSQAIKSIAFAITVFCVFILQMLVVFIFYK